MGSPDLFFATCGPAHRRTATLPWTPPSGRSDEACNRDINAYKPLPIPTETASP